MNALFGCALICITLFFRKKLASSRCRNEGSVIENVEEIFRKKDWAYISKNQFRKSITAWKIIMNPNINAVKLYTQIPICGRQLNSRRCALSSDYLRLPDVVLFHQPSDPVLAVSLFPLSCWRCYWIAAVGSELQDLWNARSQQVR